MDSQGRGITINKRCSQIEGRVGRSSPLIVMLIKTRLGTESKQRNRHRYSANKPWRGVYRVLQNHELCKTEVDSPVLATPQVLNHHATTSFT